MPDVSGTERGTGAHRIAVDIGGTFTDLVHSDPAGGWRTTKVLSTPPRLVHGVLRALEAAAVPPADIEIFVHGTTQGLNAVLERRGARVALITTAGFRDVYLIGRGHRPDMYNLRYRKPAPLLDRDAIFEVTERLDAYGAEIEPVDEGTVRAAAARIADDGYDAVAVCLLHSYLNPEHERTVARVLAAALPKVPVVTSHQVAPEWREFERTSTTVMSAYITPIMHSYLSELEQELRLRGLAVPVYVTESNGGVMTASLARDHAVGTLLSGPVGGVIGTQALSDLVGQPDLISADVGGTSFDVSLVRGGEPSVRTEFELQGLPVLAPAVEVHTIGAGGGSIISCDPQGRLRVGPESAGAVPGPASYGLGGTAPTVTDAHLVLGRIPAQQRLGGTLELDVAAARSAMEVAGAQLGLSATELAEQALEVVNFRMAEAIRELTVERGLDPRGFTLCAFGGAGGLHAVALAEELEIPRIIVPTLPGSFSAWGMLQGGIRHDVVRSFFRNADSAAADLPAVLDGLETDARALLSAEGVTESDMVLAGAADMRYAGQEYTLRVAIPPSRSVADLVAIFHDAYRERYGHANAEETVQFVALRITGSVAFTRRAQPEPGARTGIGDPADSRPTRATVSARFSGRDLQTAVVQRSAMTDGPVSGPALIYEDTATTVVPPGWSATLGAGGHLILDRIGDPR